MHLSALTDQVARSLTVAAEAIRAAVAGERSGPRSVSTGSAQAIPSVDPRVEAPPLLRGKVLAEAAMLLRATGELRLGHPGIERARAGLTNLLLEHARGPELLIDLTRQPGFALDHAATHLLLRAEGYPDPDADALLDAALDIGVAGGERLPHRLLEQQWLLGLRDPDAAGDLGDSVAGTCLARPLDILGAEPDDLYAFTHAILYATDLGRTTVRPPRPIEVITADAEAGLAAALDADNFDLAAELLWTWPMLRRPLSPAARFGLDLLLRAADEHGFLPGPGFSPDHHRAAPEARARSYALRSSYHATLVLGLCCAALIRTQTHVDSARQVGFPGAPPHFGAELPRRDPRPTWELAFADLAEERQGVLGTFLLAVALRRSAAGGDLVRLRSILRLALAYGLVDGPAPRQALSLLRRSTLLASRLADRAARARRPG